MRSIGAEQSPSYRFPPLVWRAGLPAVVGVVLALLPAPAGLAPHAWHYFAAFTTVVLAVVTEPIALAGVGLIGVIGVAVSGLAFSPAQVADPGFRLPAESLKFALAGFSNGTVWLVFAAFVLALGVRRPAWGAASHSSSSSTWAGGLSAWATPSRCRTCSWRR